MNTKRKRLALAATAVLLSGLALPAAPAVAAAPADSTTPVAVEAELRGTAPSCVRRDVIKQKKTVTVTNNCGRAMHLKVVINNAPDLRCWTYQNGEAWTWTWKVGSYGKVVTC